MTQPVPLRPGLHTSGTRQVLIIEDDVEVRAAALHCLGLPSCRLIGAEAMTDPTLLARFHAADIVLFGETDAVSQDVSSRLRRAFGAPVLPLLRPSVHARRRRGVGQGAGLVLGLSECRNRVRQHLNAGVPPGEMSARWGGFTLKLEPANFAFQGQGLGLTKVQAAILSLLMRHGGEVVSRAMIEETVFRDKPRSETNFISVHISRLRAKLKDTESEIAIENIKGAGYVLFWERAFSASILPAPELLLAESVRPIDGAVRPKYAF